MKLEKERYMGSLEVWRMELYGKEAVIGQLTGRGISAWMQTMLGLPLGEYTLFVKYSG
jgi:hypothetical protein